MSEAYSLEETRSLASKLALGAKRGDCYCLSGDLGAGKTEFARSFIRARMGAEVKVTSPTFNILQIYEADIPIYHFDLYRLKSEGELMEIGLEEALEKGICLIEWPQVAETVLPAERVNIHIDILDENRRKITLA